jgi:hypothetical protein
MATIRDLSFNDTPQPADQVPVYSTTGGITQRTSINKLLSGGLSNLPTVQPVSGSGELWVDPADDNAVKVALSGGSPGSNTIAQTVTQIANGTAVSAGVLTGSETVPASRGSGLLQTTVNAIASFVISTFTTLFVSGTGAIARTIAGKIFEQPVSVKDFGALCDWNGTTGTDDTAAIQAAINYVNGKGGGKILIPGIAKCAGSLNCDGMIDIQIVGGSWVRNLMGVSGLMYTGTGARFLSARGTSGFRLDGISVAHTSSSFTGILVDLTGSSAQNTLFYSIRKSLLGTYNGPTSATLLSINGSANGLIDETLFSGGSIQAQLTTIAATLNDFCNSVEFRKCTFSGASVATIKGGGQGITLDSNTFEGSSTTAPMGWDFAGCQAQGIAVRGSWLGDAAANGTWFVNMGQVSGFVFDNNYVGGNTAYTTGAIDLTGCISYSIKGNFFYFMTNGISASSVTTGGEIKSNSFIAVTNPLGAAPANFCNTDLAGNTPSISGYNALGNIGEYRSATVASGVSLTNVVAANIASISLPPGDWDVSGVIQFSPAASTVMTGQYSSISTVSATTAGLGGTTALVGNVPAGSGSTQVPSPVVRVSVLVTTTVYLVAVAAFSVSTLTAGGVIRARRAVPL